MQVFGNRFGYLLGNVGLYFVILQNKIGCYRNSNYYQ
jgi:hypothetical protein